MTSGKTNYVKALAVLPLLVFLSCQGPDTIDENSQLRSAISASDSSSTNCGCIDSFFSSSTEEPIAIVHEKGRSFAFCGYLPNDSDLGNPRPDPTCLLSGYELIDCETKSSVFREGEYYNDSLVLNPIGFELFRLTCLINPSGGKCISIPALEFKIHNSGDSVRVDTLFAIPKAYYQDYFIQRIEDRLLEVKSDKPKNEEAKALEMQLLFLKALSSEKYWEEFYESGPYDGYLGPVFEEYKMYLRFKGI